MEATQVSTEVRIDKQNVVETYAPIWKNLEDAMLSETNQSQKTNTVWFYLNEILKRAVKIRDRQCNDGCQGLGGGGNGEWLFNVYRASVLRERKNYGAGW